jgi:hypothetical protein
LIRHGTPERSIKQIGQAVLESFHEGSIGGKGATFEVHADRKDDGTVFCWLAGGTAADQAIFLRAMRSVLGPIQNPRYLIARRKIVRFFREDYFSVPDEQRRPEQYCNGTQASLCRGMSRPPRNKMVRPMAQRLRRCRDLDRHGKNLPTKQPQACIGRGRSLARALM